MLVLLKLGGSLITNKDQAYSARLDVIRRTSEEIKQAMIENPDLKIVLGHGSGSFGHFAAKEIGFKNEVLTASQWQGFQKVWHAAHNLNNIVIEEFYRSGLSVVSFPPSASITTTKKEISEWNIDPLKSALANNLIPVIFGDTVFDNNFGGIILSTEELFLFLINKLNPDRIILAGKEPGVWADFPLKKHLVSKITPENYPNINLQITSSQYIDVTGGMQKKVSLMLKALSCDSRLSIEIISGEAPRNIYKSLNGVVTGTVIAST